MSFEGLSTERRAEIMQISSAEEYKELTDEEKAYYRLTEPVINTAISSEPPLFTEKDVDALLDEGKPILMKRKNSLT